MPKFTPRQTAQADQISAAMQTKWKEFIGENTEPKVWPVAGEWALKHFLVALHNDSAGCLHMLVARPNNDLIPVIFSLMDDRFYCPTCYAYTMSSLSLEENFRCDKCKKVTNWCAPFLAQQGNVSVMGGLCRKCSR